MYKPMVKVTGIFLDKIVYPLQAPLSILRWFLPIRRIPQVVIWEHIVVLSY